MSGIHRRVGLPSLLACFGAGLMAAVALVGCGGNGNVAGQVSTGGSLSVTRSAAATQGEEATVVPSTAAGETQAQSVQTVTETRPAATVSHSATVSQSATVQVTVTTSGQAAPQTTATAPVTTAAAPTTTAAPPTESDSSNIWIWAVAGAVAAALIALVVWFLRRSSSERAAASQELRVGAAIASWSAQGWEIEIQTSRSAVLRRDGERVAVSLEPDGSVASRRLESPGEGGSSAAAPTTAPRRIDR